MKVLAAFSKLCFDHAVLLRVDVEQTQMLSWIEVGSTERFGKRTNAEMY